MFYSSYLFCLVFYVSIFSYIFRKVSARVTEKKNCSGLNKLKFIYPWKTESVGEQLRAFMAALWSSVVKSSPFILLLFHLQYMACTLWFKTAIKFYLVAHLIFRSGEKEKKSMHPFSFLISFVILWLSLVLDSDSFFLFVCMSMIDFLVCGYHEAFA